MEKSRNLSNEEYLKILQLEYLSHKLRALIYQRPEFKKMNNDIAEKKREKIINLSDKFRLINIFESDFCFELFWKNDFLNDKGLPNFQYNPKNKDSIEYWDKFYSFYPKSKVFYKGKEFVIKKNKVTSNSLLLYNNKNVSYNEVVITLFYNLSIDSLK